MPKDQQHSHNPYQRPADTRTRPRLQCHSLSKSKPLRMERNIRRIYTKTQRRWRVQEDHQEHIKYLNSTILGVATSVIAAKILFSGLSLDARISLLSLHNLLAHAISKICLRYHTTLPHRLHISCHMPPTLFHISLARNLEARTHAAYRQDLLGPNVTACQAKPSPLMSQVSQTQICSRIAESRICPR